MPTTYSPEQITAAHHVHDTCHELMRVAEDEPERAPHEPASNSWWHWRSEFNTAYRLHDDAEAEYRHAFPDPATRPEAHDVIAAVTRTRVELLRAHVALGWDWVDTEDDSPIIRATCRCGATADGAPPATGPDACSEESAAAWVLAAHVAAELGAF